MNDLEPTTPHARPCCPHPPGRCPGHNRDGDPCGHGAGHGTDHTGFGLCKHHGGSSPGGRKAAATEQAKATVLRMGLPREIDPHEALLEELHRSAGVVAFLDSILGEVETQKTLLSSESPYVRIYREERKHYAAIARSCVDAGIAERRVEMEADRARFVAVALTGAVDEVELAPDVRALLIAAFLRRLRGAVAAGDVVVGEVAR